MVLVHVWRAKTPFCSHQLICFRAYADAGLQDGVPHFLVSAVDVRVAAGGDGARLPDRAADVLALLDRLRHRRPRRRVQGALRRHLPRDGHTRHRGLLGAPQALPRDLRWLLRRGIGGQPLEGRRAEERVEVHSDTDGGGDSLLHRGVLRDRHVRRDGDIVHVGAREP